MGPRMQDPRVRRVIAVFQTLSPAEVARLDRLYASDARFKDPFNEVQGLAAIQRIFEHMFATLGEPHFKIQDALVQGDRAFLSWDFHARLDRGRGQALSIHGATLLHFGPDGRIVLHRDYWDAAEELYEKLPLLGRLMRWLKRRARAR